LVRPARQFFVLHLANHVLEVVHDLLAGPGLNGIRGRVRAQAPAQANHVFAELNLSRHQTMHNIEPAPL
jgi:hypothetical protein